MVICSVLEVGREPPVEPRPEGEPIFSTRQRSHLRKPSLELIRKLMSPKMIPVRLVLVVEQNPVHLLKPVLNARVEEKSGKPARHYWVLWFKLLPVLCAMEGEM